MTDDPISRRIRLRERLSALRDIDRTNWQARRADISAAWADEPGAGRLRVAALTPVSVGQQCLWSLQNRALRTALRLGLALEKAAYDDTDAKAPVGRPLAEAVAARLIETRPDGQTGFGSALVHHHRFYCGYGLFHGWEGEPLFSYGPAEDGCPAPSRSVEGFETRDAFVGWLATMSDYRFSGIEDADPHQTRPGNQRLTVARLRAYIEGPA
ncbi:hypothetical protein [Jannaschia aquimarina]|uniref:Uncharacterized protein n=1 Tax=Jannaschia aquimarina TaxID=935700 RepID=A0A0D1DD64_9RHOB|nr:hypothetical protein [Jannaschia aquimarina]KIT17933.1 hypothetical protein jaqu_02890 [Jannaschia aquimarina]SNT08640.1 hypothetical protein SAMN05421775_105184 [Jannaschia aquimarina]